MTVKRSWRRRQLRICAAQKTASDAVVGCVETSVCAGEGPDGRYCRAISCSRRSNGTGRAFGLWLSGADETGIKTSRARGDRCRGRSRRQGEGDEYLSLGHGRQSDRGPEIHKGSHGGEGGSAGGRGKGKVGWAVAA